MLSFATRGISEQLATIKHFQKHIISVGIILFIVTKLLGKKKKQTRKVNYYKTIQTGLPLFKERIFRA